MRTKISRSAGLSVLLLVSMVGEAMAAKSDQRLVAAAKEQDLQAVRALLKADADVNTRRADGATALLWAAHWDELEMADLLLRAGADVNAAENRGVTPLALACENRSAPMVVKLLASGARPNVAQKSGVTPLMTAARTGDLNVVKALLAHGADLSVAIPATAQTALMWATAEGHLEVMRALITAGADVHASSKIGFTPLLFAARNGDLEAVKVLISAGVGVNERGSDGTHALPLAIVSGRGDVAMFLLEQGADPSGTMHGVGALHAAVGRVDDWLNVWLRERGHHFSYFGAYTAALEQSRRLPLVKALLAAGADPNARITTATLIDGIGLTGRNGARESLATGTGNAKGATPLWVTALSVSGPGRWSREEATAGPAEIVRVLLEAGANPNLTTEDGTTPLMLAAGLGTMSRQPEKKRSDPSPSALAAVKVLVEAGAKVNAVNEANFTALHGAAFSGSNEIIQYLVDQGAEINVQDFSGRTPFHIAVGAQQGPFFQSWPETADFLKELGSEPRLGAETRRTESGQQRGNSASPDKP
jgi:ankyrin repeat protein